MRRTILVFFLFCAAPAFANSFGQFSGHITSFETLTLQGTYVNSLGTLRGTVLSGWLDLLGTPSSIANLCEIPFPNLTNPTLINCSGGGGNCSGPIEISITSNAGSMDNYDGNDGCTYSAFTVTSVATGVTGSITGLDFYPNAGPAPYTYEGITLNFNGPPLPRSATLWDFPNFASQWTGNGSFFQYTKNAQFTNIAGFEGTFKINRTPEPGALTLFAAGFAGIALGLRRRSLRRTA